MYDAHHVDPVSKEQGVATVRNLRPAPRRFEDRAAKQVIEQFSASG